MKKSKSIYCYLDGKEHCDVIQWALAANVNVTDAIHILKNNYPLHKVTFIVK